MQCSLVGNLFLESIFKKLFLYLFEITLAALPTVLAEDFFKLFYILKTKLCMFWVNTGNFGIPEKYKNAGKRLIFTTHIDVLIMDFLVSYQ